MKKTILFLTFIIFNLISTRQVHAFEKEAGNAGILSATQTASIAMYVPERDSRVIKIQNYLRRIDSPLYPYAEEFVKEADTNELDWKLVVSIAGLESTYGKFTPSQSYNAWGWGIFTGETSGKNFSNWNEGIKVVSQGLREEYYNNGYSDLNRIGYRYAASPTWASRVSYIMSEIEKTSDTPAPEQITMNW